MARKDKIMTLEQAVDWIQQERAREKRIVFTNGCFDILHAGHVEYLEYARSLGDVLVVAVNNDESVRRLKGRARPINQLADRLSVLAGLESIACLVSFGERTPEHIIMKLQPDIFVKGSEYRLEDLPEGVIVNAYGGKIHLAPMLDGFSTTSIEQKIQHASQKR